MQTKFGIQHRLASCVQNDNEVLLHIVQDAFWRTIIGKVQEFEPLLSMPFQVRMADDTSTMVGRKPDSDLSPQEVGERIIGLCKDFPQGLSDKVLQNEMPGIEPKSRALAINQVLSRSK